jgi:hypothetical protein
MKALLAGMLGGLVTVALQILADEGQIPEWQGPAFNPLLLIPALYIALVVHELSHLLSGKLAGLDSGGLAVGGFIFLKSGNNWTVQFNWRYGMGGFFKPIFKPDQLSAGQFPRSRLAWTIAAGPLGSAALAAFCLAIVLSHGDKWGAAGTLFWVACFTLSVSAIPFTVGLQKTDATLLRLLLRDPAGTRDWVALLELQTQEARGQRPRDWNEGLMRELINVPAASNLYVFGQLMAFYYRLDRQADEAAIEHLENLLAHSSKMPERLRRQIFLEAACASAQIRHDPATAREWRTRACKRYRPESLDVANASIAMCEGRYEEALRHWESAQARVARRRLDSGLIRFAKERWAAYQEKCRSGSLQFTNSRM